MNYWKLLLSYLRHNVPLLGWCFLCSDRNWCPEFQDYRGNNNAVQGVAIKEGIYYARCANCKYPITRGRCYVQIGTNKRQVNLLVLVSEFVLQCKCMGERAFQIKFRWLFFICRLWVNSYLGNREGEIVDRIYYERKVSDKGIKAIKR